MTKLANQKSQKLYCLKWTYWLFGNDYIVASLSKRYMTAKGIISLNSTLKKDHPLQKDGLFLNIESFVLNNFTKIHIRNRIFFIKKVFSYLPKLDKETATKIIHNFSLYVSDLQYQKKICY